MAPGGDEDSAGWLGQAALAYADTLYNFARYLSGNRMDAEDLVQETYARALRAAHQFEPGTNLKAWLFRILRNAWISLARRRRSDPTIGGFDTVTSDVEPEPTWFCDDVELDRLRKRVAADIEQALLALSDEARTIVLLDLEGLTETDVAAVLGCPVGTVKSRLSRARQALRRQLKDYTP
jgi:RNA polymerase sigma-70 factor, ECF subfamily